MILSVFTTVEPYYELWKIKVCSEFNLYSTASFVMFVYSAHQFPEFFSLSEWCDFVQYDAVFITYATA